MPQTWRRRREMPQSIVIRGSLSSEAFAHFPLPDENTTQRERRFTAEPRPSMQQWQHALRMGRRNAATCLCRFLRGRDSISMQCISTIRYIQSSGTMTPTLSGERRSLTGIGADSDLECGSPMFVFCGCHDAGCRQRSRSTKSGVTVYLQRRPATPLNASPGCDS